MYLSDSFDSDPSFVRKGGFQYPLKVSNEAKCLETTMSINTLHNEDEATMDAVDLSYEGERMMGDTRRMEKKL